MIECLHKDDKVNAFMLAGYSEEQAITMVKQCERIANRYSGLGVTYDDARIIMGNINK